MVRYVVALVVLFGFGYLLGFRVQTDLLSVLAACALTMTFAFSLSWAYVLVGVLVREPGGVQGITLLTLFPLAFGTNMVAPTETMPGCRPGSTSIPSPMRWTPVAACCSAVRSPTR